MRRQSKIQASEEPTVNLTPLIDVVFVILIMFILVAPLLELDRVELADAPHETMQKATSVQEKSLITIHVRSDNTVWVNNRRVGIGQLVAALKQARKQYPNERPQIFHDRNAYFGTYQSVKNAAEEAGFQHIDILLKPS